ncbi:MAG: hypothetical protein H0Z19_09995 [Archaeoglobus sp.]|uniref:hypothetical protein n=1 Tax=Archaeoglobus sp. TaxID=1872626 RepID=UPI001D7FB0B4|nr:hypothetical protein [Archaeoglobus sp.]MBO8180787.1 hypothetical protein [Archaeoglobus sp.]
MAMGRRALPSFGYGLMFGTLFYMMGGVANQIFPSITPELAGAMGFLSGVVIGLLEKEYQNEKGRKGE